MSDGYLIVSLDEIEAVPYHQRGGERLIPVQRRLGYRAAGVNGWLGDPGETLVPQHKEDTQEELYVVVRGRATFTIDGTKVDAPAGTLVHVAPTEERTAVAEEAGTILLSVGGTPGEAYKPNGWTSFVVADALRREGRLDEARVAILEPLELFPDAWHAPYNVACFEALAGDADAAFEYLRRAHELEPDAVREYAPGDSDLDSLHDDRRWQELFA